GRKPSRSSLVAASVMTLNLGRCCSDAAASLTSAKLSGLYCAIASRSLSRSGAERGRRTPPVTGVSTGPSSEEGGMHHLSTRRVLEPLFERAFSPPTIRTDFLLPSLDGVFVPRPAVIAAVATGLHHVIIDPTDTLRRRAFYFKAQRLSVRFRFPDPHMAETYT